MRCDSCHILSNGQIHICLLFVQTFQIWTPSLEFSEVPSRSFSHVPVKDKQFKLQDMVKKFNNVHEKYQQHDSDSTKTNV